MIRVGLVAAWVGMWGSGAVASEPWRNGDLIFHTSQTAQSRPIRVVTRSPLSHCGLLWHDRGHWWVFEAARCVQRTRLEEFLDRGQGRYYRVKRYVGGLSKQQRLGMWAEGRRLLGRAYDAQFQWGDEQLYCSELVWMVFARGAGIRLGEPQRFGQLDLSSSAAQALIRERRLPQPEELVVTPAALDRLKQLETVGDTYPAVTSSSLRW